MYVGTKVPEWRVRCTSIVQPNRDGYFKVLIENHGVCPVYLEAAHVVGSLSSVTKVPSANLPGLWDKQFELVSDSEVDVTLCSGKPRVETLLQSIPVNWQSLDKTEVAQLQSLIEGYADIFAMDHMELGKIDLVQHVIDTGSHTPIKQPPCSIPFSLRSKVETLVQEMLSQGIVKEFSSPSASPIVLVMVPQG